MKLKKTQIGTSVTADFQENTWTLKMQEDFKISTGDFALIPILRYFELIMDLKGIRNSINVHPDCEENSEFEDMVRRIDEILENLE